MTGSSASGMQPDRQPVPGEYGQRADAPGATQSKDAPQAEAGVTGLLREAATEAHPFLETLHSVLPEGEARKAVWRTILKVRAALRLSGGKGGER